MSFLNGIFGNHYSGVSGTLLKHSGGGAVAGRGNVAHADEAKLSQGLECDHVEFMKAGFQKLTGHTSNDVFVVDAPSEQYTVTANSSSVSVIGNCTWDTLINFEQIKFSDGILDLRTGEFGPLPSDDYGHNHDDDDQGHDYDDDDVPTTPEYGNHYSGVSGTLLKHSGGGAVAGRGNVAHADEAKLSQGLECDHVEFMKAGFQKLTGHTSNDVFVVDAPSEQYTVTANSSSVSVIGNCTWDTLINFEQIKFSDGILDLRTGEFGPLPSDDYGHNHDDDDQGHDYDDDDVPTTPEYGVIVDDVANETQFLNGTAQEDVFKIDGNVSDYGYGPTEDGQGIVVWGPTGFDILHGFEKIEFNNGLLDLASGDVDYTGSVDPEPTPDPDPEPTPDPDPAPTPAVNEIIDTANTTEWVMGTDGTDAFVIDANSDEFGIGKTEDGEGFVVYNDDTFDILADIELVQFNDTTITLDEIA